MAKRSARLGCLIRASWGARGVLAQPECRSGGFLGPHHLPGGHLRAEPQFSGTGLVQSQRREGASSSAAAALWQPRGSSEDEPACWWESRLLFLVLMAVNSGVDENRCLN